MILPLPFAASPLPQRLDLGGAWRVTQAERGIDVPGRVPGSVHTDLLAAGKIPDPFYRDGEKRVEWVGEVPWIYARNFAVPASLLNHRHVVLRCEGLDTLATIRLNGREVAKTDNLFRTWEFDAKPFLKPGENAIAIWIDPVGPVLKAKENQAAFPGKPSWGQGYVRKTPVQNGWDFAPKLLTAGIPRPIGLVAWDEARLSHVLVVQTHAKGAVRLGVETTAQVDVPAIAETTVTLDGQPIASGKAPFRDGKADSSLIVSNPKLWWPAGMGGQPLYDVRTVLRDAQGRVLDKGVQHIGLRTIVWTPKTATHPLSVAVNGRPFFVKGANWIPPDALNARVSTAQYVRLVGLAKAANMNMLRFWGGGLYEDDALYDLCDRTGLLVWFEFKFACTPYPAFDPNWVEGVKREAEDNVLRLRNHPSIAIWSGNNEVGGFVADKTSPFRMSREDYDGLFHGTLANVVRDLVPHAQYTPGSPESGDEHNWAVWHGGAPFETYRDDHGFMSEFGFQSFPEPRTMDAVLAPEDRDSVLSPMMKFRQHNIGGHGNENIADTVERYFRKPKDFDSTLWASQILQAQGILTGVEHWRRDWPRSTGSLVWQFDDDWPAPSWSMIDYAGRPKALYYRLKDAYAPTMLSSVADDAGDAELWIANDRPEPVRGALAWTVTRADGTLLGKGERSALAPAGTSSARAAKIDMAPYLARAGRDDLILWAELRTSGDVSRTRLAFVKPKALRLADPGIQASVAPAAGGVAVTLTARRPALWAWIEAGDARYSDNFIDLRPGEPRTILVQTKAPLERVKRSLKARSLVDTYDPTAPLPDLTLTSERDGTIVADAAHAELDGGLVLEKSEPANLGNWASAKDRAEWRVANAKPGTYEASIVLASPEGGSRFEVAAGGSKVEGTVPRTGAWTTYETLRLGRLTVPTGGPLRITLRPLEKRGSHVMNLRSLVLRRIG